MFFHFLTPDTYSWLTLGVFTLLTIGDFARIRAGGDGASAVSLALSIYLDSINIFLAVLQLMGGRRSRDNQALETQPSSDRCVFAKPALKCHA